MTNQQVKPSPHHIGNFGYCIILPECQPVRPTRALLQSKHSKACLRPAFVTVLHQVGPPLAHCSLWFYTGGSAPWHSVLYNFTQEGAPLGTPFVTVLHQRGLPSIPSELSAIGVKQGVRSVRELFPHDDPPRPSLVPKKDHNLNKF